MTKTQWIGFMLALLLSIAGIFYLWNQAGSFNILSFHWGWVLITFLSFLLLWFCDSSALRSILQSQGIKVPILLLFKLTLSGFFFGAITPFQIGNIPALTVLLEKNNVPLETGIPSVLLKSTINGILRSIISLMLAFYLKDTLQGSMGKILFTILLLYGWGVLSGYFLVISKSRFAIKIRDWLSSFLNWFGDKIPSWKTATDRISNSFQNSPETLAPLFKNKSWIIPTFFFILLFWITLFSMPYFIVRSLHLQAPFLDMFMLQASYYMLQSFLPSPGGSGLAEVSIGYIYTSFIGGSSPTFIFLLRFFTYYLPMIFGAIFLFTKHTSTKK